MNLCGRNAFQHAVEMIWKTFLRRFFLRYAASTLFELSLIPIKESRIPLIQFYENPLWINSIAMKIIMIEPKSRRIAWSINESNYIIKTAQICFSSCVDDVVMTSCDVDNNGVGGSFFLHDPFLSASLNIRTIAILLA